MRVPMAPHTLHMPGWMDEELRLLAFHAKASKTDLVRAMIAVGLASCWDHLRDGTRGPHPILDRASALGTTGTEDVHALFQRLIAPNPRDDHHPGASSISAASSPKER